MPNLQEQALKTLSKFSKHKNHSRICATQFHADTQAGATEILAETELRRIIFGCFCQFWVTNLKLGLWTIEKVFLKTRGGFFL